MSQNTQIIPQEVISREVPAAPELPVRPLNVSPAAIEQGTNFTILFLALENFCNRYPNLKFVQECIQTLRTSMNGIFESDRELHHEIRSFISCMPLDAIAQSAHPKKIKQLLLEAVLSPDSLSEKSFRTDPQEQRTFTLHDIARDIQYYTRLCELSNDAVSARETLTHIMKRAYLLSESAQSQLNSAIESFSFKFLTDKTFCLNKKGSSTSLSQHPSLQTTGSKVAPLSPSPAHEHTDIALKAISLFRHFEQLSRPVVSDGGETYESIQSRVQEQQRLLGEFKKECAALKASVREDIYRHISSSWSRFSRGDSARIKRQGTFLDFLSNPA